MKFPMSGDRSWRNAFRAVRKVPVDVVAVVSLVVVVDVVAFVPQYSETVLRPLLALPLLFFVPGYALLAALFPRRSGAHASANAPGGAPVAGRGIDWAERLSLSFGVSVVLLPLFGVGLAFAGRAITTSTVVLSLGGFAVGAMVLASVRRWRLPPETRFRVPYERWLEGGRAAFGGSRREALLNVALAVSIVLATGGFAFALAAPNDATTYTEFAVLSGGETGNPVSADYPDELTEGEPVELVVGIDNEEGETVEYTVVVALERVDPGAGVVERERLGRLTTSVQPGEIVHERHDVTPSMTGENLRVSYYLYRGEPPAEPSPETAYRHLYFWTDVSGEE